MPGDIKNEERRTKLMNKVVFNLFGEEVVRVLKDMGKEYLAEDLDELEKLLIFMEKKAKFEWTEELMSNIEIYEMRKRLD